MEKEDVKLIQEMIEEYGAHETLQGFILALREAADAMSDMRLKERAANTVYLAEILQEVNITLGE